jgi:hypothetical protein
MTKNLTKLKSHALNKLTNSLNLVRGIEVAGKDSISLRSSTVRLKDATPDQVIQGLRYNDYTLDDIKKFARNAPLHPKIEYEIIGQFGELYVLGLGIMLTPKSLKLCMATLAENFTDKQNLDELDRAVKGILGNKNLLKALNVNQREFVNWVKHYKKYALFTGF